MRLLIAEEIEDYKIEPELLHSSPRKLRVSGWSAFTFSIWLCAFIFIITSVVFIAYQSWRMRWLAENGQTTTAWISGCTYRDGSSGSCELKKSAVSNLLFRFSIGKTSHQGSISWNPQIEENNAFGQRITNINAPVKPIPSEILIRYGFFGGKLICSPASVLSKTSSEYSLLGSLIVGTICLFMASRWLMWHSKISQILKYGEPVTATVIEKTINDDDGPKYFVKVGFRDSKRKSHLYTERCTPEQWRHLDIGQPITVLNLASNERSCAIYRHLPIKCG